MMEEFWIKLVEKEITDDLSVFQFWNGVDVWIERPHIVNRKLLGKELVLTFCVPYSRIKSNIDFNNEKFQYYLREVFASQDLNQYLSRKIDVNQELNEKNGEQFLLTFRKLIPRNLEKFSEVMEAVIRDEQNNVVTFWPKESDLHNLAVTPIFPYRIKLDNNRIFIETYEKSMKPSALKQASKEWLKSSVFPKIIKWCCCSPTSVLPSLCLVSEKNYSVNYNYLKKKHGKKYVEIWPEVTDPLKYVYEDIAIAAYLITLWDKERADLNLPSKQKFVDLGCGNGLLVNILASEGYEGIGIDVRKRKIWDLYEKNTTLIEKAIEPSDYHVFPSYDWIIGNHSDELTPWIPVIAGRSSYKMRVFLLPCCSYSFNGKYDHCSQGKTQYQSYLSFIHSLCECMGFNVQEDKLRIPSTKRTCFVCSSRYYNEEDEIDIDNKRTEFIKSHSGKAEKTSSCGLNSESAKDNGGKQKQGISNNLTISKEENWIANFKPRERVELVQNCTQLDRKFLENTVLTVINLLLKTENFIPLQRGTETIVWNAGGKIKLSDLIELLDPSILKCMKNQCGGFQTFLRNHRNVFQIIGGNVQLNVPLKGIPLNSKPTSKRKRLRKKEYSFQEKPCYFFFHHPQGCPLMDCDCNFSHKVLQK